MLLLLIEKNTTQFVQDFLRQNKSYWDLSFKYTCIKHFTSLFASTLCQFRAFYSHYDNENRNIFFTCICFQTYLFRKCLQIFLSSFPNSYMDRLIYGWQGLHSNDNGHAYILLIHIEYRGSLQDICRWSCCNRRCMWRHSGTG